MQLLNASGHPFDSYADNFECPVSVKEATDLPESVVIFLVRVYLSHQWTVKLRRPGEGLQMPNQVRGFECRVLFSVAGSQVFFSVGWSKLCVKTDWVGKRN